MAREYAKVKVSIWSDTQFRELSVQAQRLYFTLLTSPTLNLCGVADWRPKRLAMLGGDTEAADVIAAAVELAERRYIIADDESEEVLIRTFVRHDGVMKGPNTARALAKDFAGIGSLTIRGILVHELRRLLEDEPDIKGANAIRDIIGEPVVDPFDIDPLKGMENPSGMGIEMGSEKVSTIPQPATTHSNPHPRATAEPPREDVEHLCNLLADLIEANGSKRPKIGKTWHEAARLMLDRDERPHDEAADLIRWCQRDEFWRTNVLSMPTFREKYDQLRLKAQGQRNGLRAVNGERPKIVRDQWLLR